MTTLETARNKILKRAQLNQEEQLPETSEEDVFARYARIKANQKRQNRITMASKLIGLPIVLLQMYLFPHTAILVFAIVSLCLLAIFTKQSEKESIDTIPSKDQGEDSSNTTKQTKEQSDQRQITMANFFPIINKWQQVKQVLQLTKISLNCVCSYIVALVLASIVRETAINSQIDLLL